MKASSCNKICFLLILLLLFFCSCSKINVWVEKNPNNYVATALSDYKIVMIANYDHGNPEVYENLIDVLNKWLDIKSRNDKKVNLYLVMERLDTNDINGFNLYIKDGNINHIYKDMHEVGTLEDIEFLDNLRAFNHRIDSLNEPRENKIIFKILGFEDDEIWLTMSREQSDRFFVNNRDSLVSFRLINYLKDKEDSEVLMLYGSGHFQASKITKPMKYISESESKGYFIAHYLIHEYGKDNILRIAQGAIDSNKIKNSIFIDYLYDDFITDIETLPFEDLKLPDQFDKRIIRHERTRFSPNKITNLFTSDGIRKAAELLKYLESFFPSGEEAKSEHDEILENLYLFTGEKFENEEQLTKWLDTHEYNCFKYLDDTTYLKRIYNYFKDNVLNISKMKLLTQIGYLPSIIYLTAKDTDKVKYTLPETRNQLIGHRLVLFYWLGNEEEKAEAKKYLDTIYGVDFGPPVEYLKKLRYKVRI